MEFMEMIREFELPSRYGEEKTILYFLDSWGEERGYMQEDVQELQTAVTEACLNAFEHGHGLNESQLVTTKIYTIKNKGKRKNTDTVVVKVCDRGGGICEQAMKSEPDRGWGLLLIHSMVDRVQLTNIPETGFCIEMVKEMRKVGRFNGTRIIN